MPALVALPLKEAEAQRMPAKQKLNAWKESDPVRCVCWCVCGRRRVFVCSSWRITSQDSHVN